MWVSFFSFFFECPQIAGFQSHLWNGILSKVLAEICSNNKFLHLPTAVGDLPFYQSLNDMQYNKLIKAYIPMPSKRTTILDSIVQKHTERVVRDFGISLSDLQVPPPRDVFFANIERSALVIPEDLIYSVDNDGILKSTHKQYIYCLLICAKVGYDAG